MRKIIFVILVICFSSIYSSCNEKKDVHDERLSELTNLLENENLSEQSRYAILNKIATTLHEKNPDDMVLFLTEYVEKNPDDKYNAYWLFMVASEYQKRKTADPVTEYYFERVLRNYADLTINGQSIHFSCLQNLIQISKNTANRINYFNTLINNFPKNVSITEMYVRLALEYEKEGEWNQVLKSYSLFLEQPDSSTIQIPGIPDAYANAKKMVDFSRSKRNWTFESLNALEKAVKTAISNYDWRALDSYRSQVNFFTMSWKTSESDSNAQEEFSMKNFMRGNRIRYNAELDDTTNTNEAYLRTTGWSTYVNVWYLYFRKVNFPVDPEIHGRWEWAGIYLGEKL